MITIQNLRYRMLTFTLPHELACAESCGCLKQARRVSVRDPATGHVGQKIEELVHPATLTLPAREASEPLPDALERAPEIEAAARAGDIKITKSEPPAARRRSKENEG